MCYLFHLAFNPEKENVDQVIKSMFYLFKIEFCGIFLNMN